MKDSLQGKRKTVFLFSKLMLESLFNNVGDKHLHAIIFLSINTAHFRDK